MRLTVCSYVCPPALWVVHEEQIEQSVSSIRQPDEFVLQVVVRLLLQTVLTDEGQLGETLRCAHTDTKRQQHPVGVFICLCHSSSPARCFHWASLAAARSGPPAGSRRFLAAEVCVPAALPECSPRPCAGDIAVPSVKGHLARPSFDRTSAKMLTTCPEM